MNTPNSDGLWTKGKPVRVCQTLPPVLLEPEVTDEGPADEVWTVGRPVRVCQTLPPVTLVMEEVAPALVLRMNGDPAAWGDAVADALLAAVARDRAAGGTGFRRDRAREAARPGVFMLALVPNDPAGPDAEARLRAVAEGVASPTVSAEVVPPA